MLGRRPSDLDLGALSGVVSIDDGIGGSALPKLGCVEWSKMGSYSFENCVVWTGVRGSDKELLSIIAKLWGWWGLEFESCNSIGRRLPSEHSNSRASFAATSLASWVSGLSSAAICKELGGAPNSDLSTRCATGSNLSISK